MVKKETRNRPEYSDEWYTPKWIIDRLGPFTLDPCSPSVRPFDTALRHYTKDDDGLSQPWKGRIWLNPPYSKKLLRAFVEKMADHNDGIALLQNRTDNLLFQEVIFPKAASILFMRHRVRFLRPDGTTGNPFFGSCLVAFGMQSDRILRDCGIEGHYVHLHGFVRMDKPFPDSAAYILQRSAAADKFNTRQSVVSVEDAYFALKMQRTEFMTETFQRNMEDIHSEFDGDTNKKTKNYDRTN